MAAVMVQLEDQMAALVAVEVELEV